MRPNCNTRFRTDSEHGFSMVEILVAIVVLSFGLLGLAGLQLQGLKNNHSAFIRSQAVNLAYDILDRMRVNRTAALNGDYAIDLGEDASCAPSCSSSAMYLQDIHDWKTALSATLPSGDGAIAMNNLDVTVTIQWNDSRGTGGGSTQSFVVRSRF